MQHKQNTKTAKQLYNTEINNYRIVLVQGGCYTDDKWKKGT